MTALFLCDCECPPRRELLQPPMVIRDDRGNLRLLEHELGNCDGVGVAGSSPGQISLGRSIPNAEKIAHAADCGLGPERAFSSGRVRGGDDTSRTLDRLRRTRGTFQNPGHGLENNVADSGSFTFKIDSRQAEKLRGLLEAQGFTFRDVPYTLFGAQKQKLTVNAYTSGKLLVQGRGVKEFIEFTLEPEILGEARLGYDEVHNPEMFQPHLGIDESGKGDFFGPLCVAGVQVEGDLPRQLLDLGVKDSKQITSDKKACDLSDAIQDLMGARRCEVIVILPPRYNELYLKFGNLNALLAWGHARVIENLLARWPDCPRALSDKFADERLIQRALQERGKKIILQQRTKAESDVAVAAASILARAAFLTRLETLGQQAGVNLPKGASPQVKAAAREVLGKSGQEGLKGRQQVSLQNIPGNDRRTGRPLLGQGAGGDHRSHLRCCRRLTP